MPVPASPGIAAGALRRPQVDAAVDTGQPVAVAIDQAGVRLAAENLIAFGEESDVDRQRSRHCTQRLQCGEPGDVWAFGDKSAAAIEDGRKVSARFDFCGERVVLPARAVADGTDV